LTGSTSDGITHQLIDSSRPHDTGTPRVRPPQIKAGMDQLAKYWKMGHASKHFV